MSLKYRRLDSNYDYSFGQGRNDYLTDVDAVAQATQTRLLLFLGEWWEDINDGLPMFQSILGRTGANKDAKDFLIAERIRGTQDLQNIESFTSVLDRVTGKYEFQCFVNTIYGKITLSNNPMGV